MNNVILIRDKIKDYQNKVTKVSGDKSLSIRFAILASLATGKSRATNLLKSEDVISTINCIKKRGIKIKFNKKICEISGKGINGYNNKKNLTLDAGNSGTAARLLSATLINAKNFIKFRIINIVVLCRYLFVHRLRVISLM